MTIKIGSLTLTRADPKSGHEKWLRPVKTIENINIALDGTPKHYHFGATHYWEIPLEFLTESDRTAIEGMRGSNITLQIDSGTSYTVRLIGDYEWTADTIQGATVYSERLKFLVIS